MELHSLQGHSKGFSAPATTLCSKRAWGLGSCVFRAVLRGGDCSLPVRIPWKLETQLLTSVCIGSMWTAVRPARSSPSVHWPPNWSLCPGNVQEGLPAFHVFPSSLSV